MLEKLTYCDLIKIYVFQTIVTRIISKHETIPLSSKFNEEEF